MTHPLPRVGGFRCAGLSAGIKKSGAPDLALIVADGPVACAGMFTTNQIVAAPVVHSRAKLAQRWTAQAIIVNSGNANACTGDRGLADTVTTAQAVADALGLAPVDVQVCSTGVIGAWLPMPTLLAGIPKVAAALTPDGMPQFAQAIMTTDTRPKLRGAQVQIGGKTISFAGASKGAGMIHPNMATMLGFVITDAGLPGAELDALWRRACQASFNAITIDGDTSTNDTALVMASGVAGTLDGADEYAAFETALTDIARELAKDIVRDAEGGTKTVAVQITGARTEADARKLADTIALSPLVKTAMHGEDPNWGRIIAAAGRAGVPLTPSALRLWIGGTLLYADGQWQGPEAEARIHTTMKTAEYDLRLDLADGDAECIVYTCDFGRDYVSINADYRS
jgi:glutamate N-acetyltransferase/amino-acid N-acetyltransferase